MANRRRGTVMPVAALLLMETGPIGPSRSDLLYGIGTIVIGVLPVALIGLAALLMLRQYRRGQARLTAVEQRLAALEQAPHDHVES